MMLKKFLFFFLLEQKEKKIQEKVIGSRTSGHSHRYLFWPTRSSNSELCVGSQRKVRTTNFVDIWRKAFAGKTKVWGWFSLALFLCFFLLEKQKKEKGLLNAIKIY